MKKENKANNEDLASVLMIRHFEQLLLKLFTEGIIKGTTHTCIGQEYIPVALRGLLVKEDFIFSNHRGHGHYLARFDDPESLLAEITGKTGAVCHGVGGSQHIYRENYISTGVQGESVSVAAGVALDLKNTDTQAMAVVYIGDGTWGEGAVYEALNIIRLWELPVLVIVENNHIAQSTPGSLNMSGTIKKRVEAFGIDYVHVKSCLMDEIRSVVSDPIQNARDARRPLVIEFETVRLGPHSARRETRSEEEMKEVQSRDWYNLYQSLYKDEFNKIEESVKTKIEALHQDIDKRSFIQEMP